MPKNGPTGPVDKIRAKQNGPAERKGDRESMSEKNEMSKQGIGRIKRGIIAILLALVLMMTTMGAYYVHAVTEQPSLLFEPVRLTYVTPTPAPTPLFDLEKYLPKAKAGTTPIPTTVPREPADEVDMDPLAEGKPLTGIVNIALFGLDAFEDGGTTSGTMVHTDTNMIVAVNFDTKEVSLISIGRDNFTDVPGHKGYYKFNGIFNVGGGLDDPKAALELSCRAAEMWLGGVSVPYYFGLDYQAIFDLVNAIGGIDYDSEIDLYDLDGTQISRRGMQHLDGRGVLAYLRMRKTAGGLDYMRTERQRKLMIALFRKLKEAGQLSMIPELIQSLGENIYTNATIVQTTALVNFAQNVDPDNVHPYSIHGGMYERYDWRYCFIFQQDRQDILKKVYGIDAEPMGVCSPVYEKFLHTRGFLALQHIGYAERLFEAIHSTVGPEDMTEQQKKLYAACWKDYTDLQAEFDLASEWTKAHYIENEKISSEEGKKRYEYYNGLLTIEERLRKSGDALNKAFGSPVDLKWKKEIEKKWYGPESVINEVYVDFA